MVPVRGHKVTAQTFPFSMNAQFGKAQRRPNSRGLRSCSCCEVRMDVKWNRAYHDNSNHGSIHEGFPMDRGVPYGPDAWYEDRDRQFKSYGHRTDEPLTSNLYYDREKGGRVADMKTGCSYYGEDGPKAKLPIGFRGGVLSFRLRVIDTCNDGETVETSNTVTVNFQ